ncbi:MAG: hypothetical protein JXA25_08360 [Anaerolineales bacterium]|nr:hypothetical protein [Anaerolineales bacterium]
MTTILHNRALHLVLLILLIILLQPSPLPDALLLDLQTQLDTASSTQTTLSTSINNISFMYPDWQDPVVSGIEMTVASENPHAALQLLDRLENTSAVAESCLMIHLQIALDEPEEAATAWFESDALCRYEGSIITPLIQYYLSKDDFIEAASLQTIAIEHSPLAPADYLNLAKIYSVFEPEKALAPLQIVRSLSSQEDPFIIDLIRVIEDSRFQESPAYTLARIGVLYIGRGEWDYAGWALTNAVLLEPEYVEALAYLGYVEDQNGENGLPQLEKAADLEPDNPLAAIFLTQHWIQQNDLDKAYDSVGEAYRLVPDNPVIAALQGEIFARMGDHDSAGVAYLRACELEPDIPDFWLLLAEYSMKYEVKVEVLGVRAARNAVLLAPQDAHALDLLGFAHYLNGSFDVAERVLQRAVAADNKHAPSFFHLGLTLLELGDTEEAVTNIKKAAELDHGGYYGNLAARTLESIQQP